MNKMPKYMIATAADAGVTLQSLGQRKQIAINVQYGTHEISSSDAVGIPSISASIEVYGVAGLLRWGPVSHLILILGREEVAKLYGSPIYVVTRVLLVPLDSQLGARNAIDAARKSSEKGAGKSLSPEVEHEASDSEHGDVDETSDRSEQLSPSSQEEENLGDHRANKDKRKSSIAQDVIERRGQYGRFVERWFSRKGWQGIPESRINEAVHVGLTPQYRQNSETLSISTSSRSGNLLPKLLHTVRMLLESRSFFFSYDIDISARIGHREKTSSKIPFHRSFDPDFFWNRHLLSPLIDSGQSGFVLPLIQGFVGQRAFDSSKKINDPSSFAVSATAGDTGFTEITEPIDVHDKPSTYLVTLISRRSIKRPGLRYLRRGIDEDGHCANTVETEQILSCTAPARQYSFTQIRASIPLFFSQSPYALKPIPVLQHSEEANLKACRRHFSDLKSRYGNVQATLLVDKAGGEAEIGQRYEASIERLNASTDLVGQNIGFEWFDFHAQCRGMKFENVSFLMSTLGAKLDDFGETLVAGGNVQRGQTGVLRTNCMDCLDRTNVGNFVDVVGISTLTNSLDIVQAACGQRALMKQLSEEGVKIDLLTDVTTQWFNTLWADNGDQLSRQYAGTAALKGDYTRTRQRNYRGAINDLGLTLSRYYNNIVNDYFSQATIDFLLGNVNELVFDEFEANLQSKDPAMSMATVRANAIEISSKIAISDEHEDLVRGWTFLSPNEPNRVRRLPSDECVLLLTVTALYRVRFDWNIDKVHSFDRIDLSNIRGLLKGTYITNSLSASQRDPERNIGFLVKYLPGASNIVRRNTRALSSVVDSGSRGDTDTHHEANQDQDQRNTSELKVIAFKALPARDSSTSDQRHGTPLVSEKDTVDLVCEDIKRAVLGDQQESTAFIEDQEIVSVEDAKKSTGLIEQWSHTLKKMVWA